MMYVDPTGNISWRQYTTLFGGILDGLSGFSGLKNLFSWSTIQGIVQFGNAIIHGNLNYFIDLVKSVGASFVEPFEYLAEHSKNVWAGKPTDQEVAQYGRSMGSVIQTIVGAVGGGGILGEKIVAQLGKICPKLLKVVDKIEEVGETAGGLKRGPKPFGTGSHNLTIKDVADSVTDGKIVAGGQRLPEVSIKTPGGIKSSRRPDILVERPDGSTYGINVGKTTASGAPIKREVEAIYDLEDAGIEMHFVPYDR